MPIRIELNDTKLFASQREGKCLSKAYIGIQHPLKWQCKYGHTWSASFDHVKHKQWCPVCLREKKRDDRERKYVIQCQNFAKEKGGLLLSKSYLNANQKLLWECRRHHKFYLSMNKVKSGRWCPECSKDQQAEIRSKQLISEAQLVAASYDGKCLSHVCNNAKTKLTWECSERHKWQAQATSVLRQGTWCPTCAGNSKLSLKQMQELANDRGGVCLARAYINTDTKYRWQCNLGHEWDATFNKIKSGQWCPICGRAGIGEEVCRTIFMQIFGDTFNKYRPRWLRNDRGNQMELDGYSKKFRIGFEYQGRQHYEYVQHFHRERTSLAQRKIDDQTKVELCREHGVRLFVIDSSLPYEDIQAEILSQCKALGVDVTKLDFDSKIRFEDAFIREDRLEELRELVESKNGTLLSKKWLGVKFRYLVKCNSDGNKWRVSGSELLGGAWCKQCAMSSLKIAHTGSLEDVVEFASQHHGVVLSVEYRGANGKYRFRCQLGHEFIAKLSNLKNRSQWCPICEKRQRRNAYPEYDYTAAFVVDLKLKSTDQWKQYIKGHVQDLPPKPDWIPSDPAKVYKNKGWESWGKWLGTGRIANQNKTFLPFQESRKFVHKLGLRSQAVWRKYVNGDFDNLPPLPSKIPRGPYSYYRDKGWISWPDFLGYERKRKTK